MKLGENKYLYIYDIGIVMITNSFLVLHLFISVL